MSCNRADPQHLIMQLQGWCESKTMFIRAPTAPTMANRPSARPNPVQLKEAKWGNTRLSWWRSWDSWQPTGGWWPTQTAQRSGCGGGNGVWYGHNAPRNTAAHVPAHERQSISRGELRGVLHAGLSCQAGEWMVIVLDSEYVFKGIMLWSDKWRRHGWKTSSGEVGAQGSVGSNPGVTGGSRRPVADLMGPLPPEPGGKRGG